MTHEAPSRQEAMARSIAGAGRTSPALPQVRLAADLVCPWCYIGFHRLARLRERLPFRLVWHPFLLNPHLPSGGVPRSLYVERKFGSTGLGDAVHRRATAMAAAEGLEIRLERIRHQPSTVAAHAMLLAAGERAPELARALFEAFFRDGQDLGSRTVLAAIGARFAIALDEPRLRAAEVSAAHDSACRSGIDGVPLFLFGDDHAIAGAQPTACLQALLELEYYRLSRRPEGVGQAQGRQAS